MAGNSSWTPVIAEVLARRGDRRFQAAVRRGIEPTTETYAYPYVLPLLEDPRQHTPVLRAAAFAAWFPSIPPTAPGSKPKRLGRFFFEVSRARASGTADTPLRLDPSRPDAISSRLQQLVNLDFEPACSMLRSMLALSEGTNVPLDYYDLTRTLLHWGHGISEESKKTRNQLLRDYFSALAPVTPADTLPPAQDA